MEKHKDLIDNIICITRPSDGRAEDFKKIW